MPRAQARFGVVYIGTLLRLCCGWYQAMSEGTTLQQIDTGANACSVEWCPVAGFESYVACSTYLLDNTQNADCTVQERASVIQQGGELTGQGDDTTTAATVGAARINNSESDDGEGGAGVAQKRTGTVVVHRLSKDSVDQAASETIPAGRLEHAGSASLDGGVLDAKWSEEACQNGAAVLACATSTGRLSVYSLGHLGEDGVDEAGAELRLLTTSAAQDRLLLSLDWSGGAVADAKIVVSQSDGELGIWRLDPAGGAPVEHTSPWPAHHLKGGIPTEAWISFFRRGAGDGGESFIVSGADDGLMKGWDLRAGGACGASPAFVCKEHDAGVTAGQWHPTREHIFVSGSYDENVRVWDARALRDPLSTTPTGGGLWRLKWHPDPSKGNLLLAACMHAGVRVLDMGVSGELEAFPAETNGGSVDEGGRILAKYTRHESMAYGADWCRLLTSLQRPRPLIASCSFYDSLLCLWSPPPLWA